MLTTREKMARNFIRSRGVDEFNVLLGMLRTEASGEAIAKRYGVSRERVRQWRDAFGMTISQYYIHPDVASVAKIGVSDESKALAWTHPALSDNLPDVELPEAPVRRRRAQPHEERRHQ